MNANDQIWFVWLQIELISRVCHAKDGGKLACSDLPERGAQG